jgi:glutathione S-transferase
MKLIGSVTSPYVRKVRVVLAEKKLDYAFELENVWAAETTIHLSNPLGKVPCLVMEDGSAMYDSRVIAEYLDTLTPVCKLLPPTAATAPTSRCGKRWPTASLDAAVLVRLEKHPASRRAAKPAWIDRQMGKVSGPASHVGKPRRAAFLHGQPLHPGRRRRRLRAGLAASASRTSTGAATIRTWRACSTSCPSAPPSRTPCR